MNLLKVEIKFSRKKLILLAILPKAREANDDKSLLITENFRDCV